MLPEPSFTLTIPSVHDGTALDCRVYHPDSFYTEGAAPWKRHAVVFAHPYAPMGGSFDDPLLDIVAEQLLRKGYLLGTFNFRYACIWRIIYLIPKVAGRSEYLSALMLMRFM
jgi:hypothetical protein